MFSSSDEGVPKRKFEKKDPIFLKACGTQFVSEQRSTGSCLNGETIRN